MTSSRYWPAVAYTGNLVRLHFLVAEVVEVDTSFAETVQDSSHCKKVGGCCGQSSDLRTPGHYRHAAAQVGIGRQAVHSQDARGMESLCSHP